MWDFCRLTWWALVGPQPNTGRRSPQADVELMTQEKHLGLKPRSRLEQVGQEHPK